MKTKVLVAGGSIAAAVAAQGGAVAARADPPAEEEPSESLVLTAEAQASPDGMTDNGTLEPEIAHAVSLRSTMGLEHSPEFVRQITRSPEDFDARMGSDTLGIWVTPEEYAKINGMLGIMENREPVLEYVVRSGAGARLVAYTDGLMRGGLPAESGLAPASIAELYRDYLSGGDAWRDTIPGLMVEDLPAPAELAVEHVGERQMETYGGKYMDWATGMLVVLFTDNVDIHEAALREAVVFPDQIRVEKVETPLLELQIRANLLSLDIRSLRDEGIDIRGVGIDVIGNHVWVNVVDARRAVVADVLTERYGLSAESIRDVAEDTRDTTGDPSPTNPCNGGSPGPAWDNDASNCDPDRDEPAFDPLQAGLAIRNGVDGLDGPCTSAFKAFEVLPHTPWSNTSLLTAGHCLDVINENVYQGFQPGANPTSYRHIGWNYRRHYGEASDASAIDTVSYLGVSDDIYERSSVTNLDITVWQNSVNADGIHDAVCMAGIRNPGDEDTVSCGFITNLTYTPSYSGVDAPDDGDWKAAFRCGTFQGVWEGDSGAPVYRNFNNGQAVRAIGIGSGRSGGGCDDALYALPGTTGRGIFTAIGFAISDLGLDSVFTS